MQVEEFVIKVQSQLAAAAALGDDATRRTAEALAVAADPAVRLVVAEAVSAAADEVTGALLDYPGAPAVSVRIDGDALRVEVRATSSVDGPDGYGATGGPGEEAENNARVSLRLPDALKAQIESAARSAGVSVNTWILRAVSASLAAPGFPGGFGPFARRMGGWDQAAGRRVTGWING